MGCGKICFVQLEQGNLRLACLSEEYYVAYARRLLSSSFINGTVTHMAPEGESWKLQLLVSTPGRLTCFAALDV